MLKESVSGNVFFYGEGYSVITQKLLSFTQL